MAPLCYLTRTESFSAAHRLHSQLLSDQDNAIIYGKCNNPHFHGHNYKVEITVKGEIDARTGMVMNLSDLKQCIKVSILDKLDHKNLDEQVAFFEKTPSTTENLAVYIWSNMNAALSDYVGQSAGVRLHKVKIYETDHNSVEYLGEGL